MSDTTSNTDELEDEVVDEPGEDEQPVDLDGEAEPAVDADAPEEEPKPTRTTGIRKPLAPARGAMAATAMAAVPASGLVGSVLYGNFGPMGIAAAGGVAAAAGGVALVVRGKKHSTKDDGKDGKKAGLPPHPLGGLKGLLGGAREKAAARREAMAQQRAARQQGRAGGVAGLLNRRGAAGGSSAAGGGRGRSALGAVAGRGAQRGGAVGRAAVGTAGRAAAAGRQPGVGKPGAGRPAAAGGRAPAGRSAAGRPAGGSAGRGGAARPAAAGRGHAPMSPRAAAASGRYVNPVTGRPMTAAQVSRAIRQQQRAQRIVADGGGYPTQIARWAVRHPRIAGWAVLGTLGAAGLATVVIPTTMAIAPVAGWLTTPALVGLATYCASRHPAVRRMRRKLWVETKYRSILAGRWLRARWRKWRGIQDEPLVGEFVPGHTPKPQPPPEPDIVDADVVPDLDGDVEPTPIPQPELVTSPPVDEPAPEPEERRRRQLSLSNRPVPPAPQPQENLMRIFDSLTESLGGLPTLSLGPGDGGGHDVERWAESLADFMNALGERIGQDAAGIVERFPMDSASSESMSQLGAVFVGIASQVHEQVEQWKTDASWQYTDNNA